MQTRRVDIAVIGDSLAACMAAALLAKHGRKVLLLSAPACEDPWQNSSLFVEKLLAALGARASFEPALPLQVLSSRARVTIHPEWPLADELSREFGRESQAVIQFLDQMEHLGRRLEQLLWEQGGLPAPGLKNTVRWRWFCLRRKFPLAPLSAPLAGKIAAFQEAAAEWLRDLFQGLALQPADALTVGDAALCWHYARASEGVPLLALRKLLARRLEQFHGIEADLDSLSSVDHHGGKWLGTFANGSRFEAGQLFIGHLDASLPGTGHPLLPHHRQNAGRHFATTPLNGKVSPLLAPQVIAGGEAPVRLVIETAPQGPQVRISSHVRADETLIRCQLEPVLPFARYDLEPACDRQPGPTSAEPPSSPPSILGLPIDGGNHLWVLDESRLLPQLGIGGAALLAWTVAQQIEPGVTLKGN